MSTRLRSSANEVYRVCHAFGKMGQEPYEYKDGNSHIGSCPNELHAGNAREQRFTECWQKFIDDRDPDDYVDDPNYEDLDGHRGCKKYFICGTCDSKALVCRECWLTTTTKYCGEAIVALWLSKIEAKNNKSTKRNNNSNSTTTVSVIASVAVNESQFTINSTKRIIDGVRQPVTTELVEAPHHSNEQTFHREMTIHEILINDF